MISSNPQSNVWPWPEWTHSTKKRLKIEESRIQDKRKPYWPSIRFKVVKRLNSGEFN